MKSKRNILVILLIGILGGAIGCKQTSSPKVSTAEDREQLFDYIIEKTKDREAFSPIKNEIMDFDPIEEMLKFKKEVIDADTDEKLFNAILKINNIRRNRHLSISTVKGGLMVNKDKKGQAPIRFRTDFSEPGNYFFFIGDMSANISDYQEGSTIDIGDKLIAVNNKPIEEYIQELIPYIRYSSINGLWKGMAESLTIQNYRFPLVMKKDNIILKLEKTDGSAYSISLPYLKNNDIVWKGYYKAHGDNRYKGFEILFSKQTFDLYVSKEKNILLFDWYGFKENLVKDVDYLLDFAQQNKMLDYPIIWDGTRCRGGSKGAYAIQRLFSKPFKTTFGNVKISDVIPLFIQDKEKDYKEKTINDGGVSETMDNGIWLMEWLRDDVQKAIANGDEYSTSVPFKSAHLPKDSDGILYPTDIHFTGPVVCLFGPQGGSHLDQFAAQVVDNKLAYAIGMPTGGYSNTWEWHETLVFPISKKPVVEFMWDIGHTIRPNGEILEGNPAQMDKYIPQTRENYLNYYDILLDEAYKYLNH